MADLSMVGIGRPENDWWFEGITTGGKRVNGLSQEQAQAMERVEKAELLKRDSQAAIDKTKQQIQQKRSGTPSQTMPQQSQMQPQQKTNVSIMDSNMNPVDQGGTPLLNQLNSYSTPQSQPQQSEADIYSQNQLTDKYSEVPEVQNYLKSEQERGLNKGISDVASNLSSGKYGQQGQDSFNVTQLTGDFTKALSDAGVSGEAINSIQDIIKNETKKGYGLGQATMQKRDDWNKIAAMPDGPEKDKAINDYLMTYATSTAYSLSDAGIGAAGIKAGVTSKASELGKSAGQTESNVNAIPGFKPIDGIKITDDSVKKVKDAAPLISNMNNIVDTILSDIKAKGSKFTGDDAAKYNANVRYLQMLAKSEPVFNLGVITGPDLMLLEQIIPDPSSLKQGMKSTFLGSAEKRLNEFKTNLNYGATEKFKANGFEREKPAKTVTPKSNNIANQQGNTVKIGDVVNGYRFKGGDPNNKNSWEKAK